MAEEIREPVKQFLSQELQGRGSPLMALSLLRRQLNGERAVVLLYVIQIVFSTPISLLPQAFSLAVLSIFALFAEIYADDDSNPLANSFTTRRGASGILLGAVTLPGIMLSRLIQILRAVSLQQIGVQEVEYLKLQFWAASASCFAVLISLCIICLHQGKSSIVTRCVFNWNTKCSCIFITLAFGIVSFSGIPYAVEPVALMLLWVLCHGLSAVKLIQKILHTFPACASIGESLLVTTGLVVYLGDILAYTAAKIPGYFAPSTAHFLQNGISRSEISTIIQGLIFGLLIFPVFYIFVLRISEHFFCVSNNTGNREKRMAFVFYASLAVMLILVPSWMQFVHPFQAHPFLWIFQFVFSEPLKRLTLCTYWLVVIYFSVRRFYSISKNSKTERILLRKYYHLMAVSIFIPALIFQPRFLNLALGAALAVFLLLEIIRIWKVWPLGHLVDQFMNAFTDHRDSDLLIVSHFSLLLGCALPIWLSSGFNDRPLTPFTGILSLGIGDTMASMVGHKYGVLRWSKTGKKTIEGTAAGITSVLAACFILLPLVAASGYIFTMHWFSLIVAVTTTGLLEAYTTQLDNAFIPFVFYSLLCL